MEQFVVAVLLGISSGLLAVLAGRISLLGWLIVAPLAAAAYLTSPEATLVAAAVAGTLASVPIIWKRGASRTGEVIEIALIAGIWGAAFSVAAWLWPHGVPAWGAVLIPAAALATSVIARYAVPPGYGGAPRHADPFLNSQLSWLPVVHISRLGSDLVIPPLLALAATAPVMLVVEWPPSVPTTLTALASSIVVAALVGFGSVSYRRVVAKVESEESIRVAAVSVDDPFTTYATSPAYADVEARIHKFEPHVARAIEQHARLIVLPEHAVIVRAQTRRRWLDAVARWAKRANAVIVTGVFDADVQQGQLVIVNETGTVAASYDKQHPVIGAEPKRRRRMHPALLEREPFSVSAVICYDMNFNDLVRPVARAGGILAVPANDWRQIEKLHPRSAVWPVVMSGVPLVRSTGHGTSVIVDAAGRLLAKASSFEGPVALVADLPVAVRGVEAKPADARVRSTAA